MPPLDDAARFPALDAGRGRLRRGATRCRARPTTAAASPATAPTTTRMAPADQDAVTARHGQRRQGDRRLRAPAALRPEPLRRAGSTATRRALDASEQRGAALFVGRGACVSCHSGPNLTDGEFHNVGLAPATVAVAFVDANDRGAAEGIAAALDGSAEHAGRVQRRRPRRAARRGRSASSKARSARRACAASPRTRASCTPDRSARSSRRSRFYNRGGDPPGHYPGRERARAARAERAGARRPGRVPRARSTARARSRAAHAARRRRSREMPLLSARTRTGARARAIRGDRCLADRRVAAGATR